MLLSARAGWKGPPTLHSAAPRKSNTAIRISANMSSNPPAGDQPDTEREETCDVFAWVFVIDITG